MVSQVVSNAQEKTVIPLPTAGLLISGAMQSSPFHALSLKGKLPQGKHLTPFCARTSPSGRGEAVMRVIGDAQVTTLVSAGVKDTTSALMAAVKSSWQMRKKAAKMI